MTRDRAIVTTGRQ